MAWSLPRIRNLYDVWLCLLLGYCCCCFQCSHAACQVKTKQGNNMILATGPFPEGIEYDQKDDRFICQGNRACQGFTISGCRYVRCVEDHACHEARISNIHFLRCHGYDSCSDATVTNAGMVHCGPMQVLPTDMTEGYCVRAKIEIKKQYLNCIGPGSCYAPAWKDRMVVNVGSHATVSCGLSTNLEKACGNMIIEVSHGNRACYATDWYQKCALYCEKDHDCAKDEIEFRVVGP